MTYCLIVARKLLLVENVNNLLSLAGRSRMLSKSSKGDAVAIAEAYRRKKRREAIGLHEDEVQKTKKFTEIINEHGSRNKHPESPALAVSHKI
jgi:hypothetical protein